MYLACYRRQYSQIQRGHRLPVFIAQLAVTFRPVLRGGRHTKLHAPVPSAWLPARVAAGTWAGIERSIRLAG